MRPGLPCGKGIPSGAVLPPTPVNPHFASLCVSFGGFLGSFSTGRFSGARLRETRRPCAATKEDPVAQRFGNQLVSYVLTLGPKGRIAEKLERVGFRETRYAYEYDPKGRLVQVSRDGRPVEKYGYDAQGRRVWDWSPQRGKRRLDYDAAGRLRRAGELEFYYRADNALGSRYQGKQRALHLDYAPDLGLRRVHATQGREVESRANPAGQPLAKCVDGQAVEAFRWLDLLRLAEYQALDKGYRLLFRYRDGHRLPSAVTYQDEEGSRDWLLGHDQVGSLKAVADASGDLVKVIDYDSFGNVLFEDCIKLE